MWSEAVASTVLDESATIESDLMRAKVDVISVVFVVCIFTRSMCVKISLMLFQIFLFAPLCIIMLLF